MLFLEPVGKEIVLANEITFSLHGSFQIYKQIMLIGPKIYLSRKSCNENLKIVGK